MLVCCMGCLQRLVESMNSANVDVLVFPTWSNPPHLIGDFYSPDGARARLGPLCADHSYVSCAEIVLVCHIDNQELLPYPAR